LNKLFISTILLLSILFTSFSTGNNRPKYQIRTIVIDAGHGGHDTGCLGSSSQEKHIALSVSLKLGALIEKLFPEVNVIYTRKTDVFIELHERAAIANRNKADLFICIHCNSGPSAAFGAETYVMGLHKTTDNLSVAKRENSSILLEKDYKNKYDGFDPNSPEANIIFSLYQNTFMNQSLNFARAKAV
jgi:N-acetylmuramoyl-L-alanine amidase